MEVRLMSLSINLDFRIRLSAFKWSDEYSDIMKKFCQDCYYETNAPMLPLKSGDL